MRDNHTSGLAGLPDRIRERLAEVGARVHEWGRDVQEDPSLLWRTTLLRVSFWVILGVIALLVVRGVSRSLLPASALRSSSVPAPQATLYVACVNPSCLETYTTQQAMNFRAWPLTCRKCAQQTVYRAKLCRKCRHWYATAPGTPDQCPFCARADSAVAECPADAASGHPGEPDEP
jgi:ribosomal protein L40E